MKINNLTFIVTDDCNFNCSYCFQKKEKKTISSNVIDTAVDFFYPFLESKDRIHIGFYGGEPLLAFEQIKHAVQRLQEKNSGENKKIGFSLTTNGSLLTGEMLDFFNRNRFSLMLSFDGLSQDVSRKQGTFRKIAPLLSQIRAYPGIDFEINSVFSPRTISKFFDSLRFIIDLNFFSAFGEQGALFEETAPKRETQCVYPNFPPYFVENSPAKTFDYSLFLKSSASAPGLNFDLAGGEEWQPQHINTLKEELAKLVDFLVLYHKETGKIPVKNFQGYTPGPGPGIFRCSAGRDHMAVTPGGDVWGCFLFHDFFKSRQESPQHRDFYFGTLADFAAHHKTRYPEILENYADLRQDFFSVEGDCCFLCPDVRKCMVCPVSAAYASGSLGKVSCGLCSLNKIQMQARETFHQRIKNS
ncbi:MAG: 4Fe-4S cluster-binding domain-containing protein [Candidatus Aminicenantes bacterium]|nr:4Fe-4S cluster-binding domain-containing protein [Candidatus Aminicenantes bacterium]